MPLSPATVFEPSLFSLLIMSSSTTLQNASSSSSSSSLLRTLQLPLLFLPLTGSPVTQPLLLSITLIVSDASVVDVLVVACYTRSLLLMSLFYFDN